MYSPRIDPPDQACELDEADIIESIDEPETPPVPHLEPACRGRRNHNSCPTHTCYRSGWHVHKLVAGTPASLRAAPEEGGVREHGHLCYDLGWRVAEAALAAFAPKTEGDYALMYRRLDADEVCLGFARGWYDRIEKAEFAAAERALTVRP